LGRKYTLRKEKLGAETVEGRACDKYKVSVTGDNNEKHEAILWCDPRLKDFPIQMQLNQPDATVIMVYRQVKLEQPDPQMFEATAGYAKYTSIEKLMQDAISKRLGTGK
jgi:hypothetical protein